MTSPGLVDAATLARSLSMRDAVDALEAAFAGGAITQAPPRTSVETLWGTMLSMPATGRQGSGVKLLTVTPENVRRGRPLIHGLYVLFAAGSQRVDAVIDGAALTALRTGAVSALATRYLAREDAASLVIFGAGVQARAHLDAMRAVRPVRRCTIVSRTPGPAASLADAARAAGMEASVGSPEAVAQADIVCTCTTSGEPVFPGALLAPGTHVNAVGAFTTSTRELDDQAIMRAKVIVETREAAFAEAGDVVIPIRAGVVRADHVVAELADLVAGTPVRTGREDVTVFKSVGVAFEDLVVARAVADRLRA